MHSLHFFFCQRSETFDVLVLGKWLYGREEFPTKISARSATKPDVIFFFWPSREFVGGSLQIKLLDSSMME